MGVRIENLTERLVLLRLNSGNSRYLLPHSSTDEILETEVGERERRLEAKSLIKIHKTAKKKASPGAPPREPVKKETLTKSFEKDKGKTVSLTDTAKSK